MLNSLEFWLILPLGIILYYQFPEKNKWSILLLGSIVYLGYLSIPFLVYAAIFSIANYFFGRLLDKQSNKVARKRLYLLFLIINIGQLVVYKYIDFLIGIFNGFFGLFGANEIPYINLLIPIGISYYTFQNIGYIVNVYRKIEKPEKHLGHFLIYNIFFPKILSGPIERSEKFLPQLRKPKPFDSELFKTGLKLLFFGMFKKLVIAERLSVIIYNVHGNVDDYSGFPLIITMLLQAIYIYTDFSGYTDIALGMANFFGIKLTNNFNRPFFATSISDLWRRWHISLTTWCNDYIFKTILFKRRKWGIAAAAYGVFITFLIIGFWHGPMWTFVILGVIQGIAINYEYFTKRKRLKIGSKIPVFWNNAISRLITFLFFSFSLIFFFSPSLEDSLFMVTHMFDIQDSVFVGNNLGLDRRNVIIALIAIVVLFVVEMKEERGYQLFDELLHQPLWARWSAYYLLMYIILMYGMFATTNFVYFQF